MHLWPVTGVPLVQLAVEERERGPLAVQGRERSRQSQGRERSRRGRRSDNPRRPGVREQVAEPGRKGGGGGERKMGLSHCPHQPVTSPPQSLPHTLTPPPRSPLHTVTPTPLPCLVPPSVSAPRPPTPGILLLWRTNTPSPAGYPSPPPLRSTYLKVTMSM